MYKSNLTWLTNPTHLDHRSPVKGDINKTHLYTDKIGHSKWIWTQPRLQINPFKISTTKGHQILQSMTKLKYIKCKPRGHNQHFVLCLFFFLEMGPRQIFLDCRVTYSLTFNNNTDKYQTY